MLISAVQQSDSVIHIYTFLLGFPDGSEGQEWACNAGDTRDMVSVPESGTPPGGGNGNPPQYSCWKNPMDRGAWQATVPGIPRVGHNLATKPPQCVIYSRDKKMRLQKLLI